MVGQKEASGSSTAECGGNTTVSRRFFHRIFRHAPALSIAVGRRHPEIAGNSAAIAPRTTGIRTTRKDDSVAPAIVNGGEERGGEVGPAATFVASLWHALPSCADCAGRCWGRIEAGSSGCAGE